MKTDILVVGGGIAGMSFALLASERFSDKKITILFKESPHESNTLYAQGGIVGVIPSKGDKVDDHVRDTMVAGNFQNKESVVQMVSQKSECVIENLIKWGVDFDRNKGGEYETLMEGGHSQRRIFHHKDKTGREIQQALVKKAKLRANITFVYQVFVVDLLLQQEVIKGVQYFDQKNNLNKNIYAPVVVLATGGLGQLYEKTTNPLVATGDGLAMAIRQQIEVEKLPFVQFHPTALYQENKERLFLISETVRGEGARLKNAKGEYFMEQYDSRLELAPRDVVARAIYQEMKSDKLPYVILEVSDISDFEQKFPTISAYCQENQIDLKEGLPVTVATHYQCGGIAVDMNGQTTKKGLFAIGEVAHTGLHGSNRLASNSLLEAVVYADVVSAYIEANPISSGVVLDLPLSKIEAVRDFEISLGLKKEIQTVMDAYMGVRKTSKGMQTALEALEKIKLKSDQHLESNDSENTPVNFLELQNVLLLAQKMVTEALKIKKNTGVFYCEENE